MAQLPLHYILKDDITDPAMLLEVELEENLQREDLSWVEEVTAKQMLHKLWQERDGEATPGHKGGHRIEDTAEKLNQSNSLVAEDLELAMFLELPEVRDAKTKSEGKKIIKRLKTTYKRQQVLNEALEAKAKETPNGTPQLTNSNGEEVDEKFQAQLVEFTSHAFYGRMEDHLPTLGSARGPFDVVFFDPPWGVNLDTVANVPGSQAKYEDSTDYMKQNLPTWLELTYEHMAENSHLYLFFGIVHHAFIYDLLEATGFQTNRMPIIWHKQGSHVTRQPELYPGRSYEPIAYARKGSKPLVKLGLPDVISTPAPTPKMKQNHPSAKHPAIYLDLLTRSAGPGDKILDPMAGSGMVAVAIEQLREKLALAWTTIELDEAYETTQLFNLTQGYSEVTKRAEVKEKTPKQLESEDFTLLEPDSDEWKLFWTKHPDKHGPMLDWKIEQAMT